MKQRRGVILLYALSAMGILVILLGGLFTYMNIQIKVLKHQTEQQTALSIAEAGLTRYQWQLAHDPDEFVEGTGADIPYGDPSGGQIGSYDVEVIPPEEGSTIVTIRSTGRTEDQPENERVIEVQYGKPSLAEFSFLTNSDVWFGDSESIDGKMHSNGGIRMDGNCNSVMSSAKETYNCKAHHGCGEGQEKPGIWGDAPPECVAFWDFPIPAYDFQSLSVDMSQMLIDAGWVLPDSGDFGYHLIFLPNGTIDVYRVTRLQNPVTAFDTYGEKRKISYDIRNEVFQENHAIPENGLIFAQDSIWVEGTVSGRVTVAVGIEPYSPETAPMIMLQDNIVYAAKDGSNVLGLIGQRDVIIPHDVPDTMEVDAVLMAINGATQRFYYPGDIKDELTTYGSIISNGVWTWAWVSGGGATVSGFRVVNTLYDPNLLYGPPPFFPTKGEYQQIRWEETTGE